MPNALLIYPEQPPTYWGMESILGYVGKKAMYPPLGLLTVAALFPPEYDIRLVDLNVVTLKDADLDWADIAFTSTMIVQQASLKTVIERCNRARVPVVSGGPHPTTYHDEIQGVDYFVLDEVEEYFPQFLQDLTAGKAKEINREPRKPDITRVPIPRFDLININDYHIIGLQFSRGCPFDCEFCDITKLYGRVARTKTPVQLLEEFELLYNLGWRGQVFLVDDNFIGNKREVMKLLPAISEWQKERGYPFLLRTEASVNLAQLDALMDAMVDAGFISVFLGIETPNPIALLKTKKPQNTSKREDNYLVKAVRKIQQKGIQVQGGFILGLDGDDESVFDAQISFVQETGISAAAVYLLTALKGTDLYKRLESENRILVDLADAPVIATGSGALNFQPEMDPETLIDGYQRVTTTLYDPALENYFERCVTLIEHLRPVSHLLKPKPKSVINADIIGVRRILSEVQIPAYIRFISYISRHHPQMLSTAVGLAAQGYHFEKVTRQQVTIYEFKKALNAELVMFEETLPQGSRRFQICKQEMFARIEARYESFPREFRFTGDGIDDALTAFRRTATELSKQFDHTTI